MESLVTTDWLARHLGAADLRLVDATLLDPALGRDARAEYVA
ncbi:MAG: sulfurtransferase, partial [Sphingomonas sp.]